MPRLYIALMHFPVKNKNGEKITSAVTNLDLHDISRVARTYGVPRYYVVTPLTDQQELVESIMDHWLEGSGAQYNPARKQALERVRVTASLDQVTEDIRAECRCTPKTVVTCARNNGRSISHGRFRNMLADNTPYLLMFGTAWGLDNAFMDEADYVLEPITGGTDYNHLSVRSAASILLDRLMGQPID